MQSIEARRDEKAFEWDFLRSARMCLYGGVWLPPFLHIWYRSLEASVGGRLGLMLLLDQALAAPLNLFAFFTILTLTETPTLEALTSRLKERYVSTLFSLWCVWPIVQVINFKYVPLSKRVLVVGGVGTMWSIYLSFIGNEKSKEKAKLEETAE